MPGDLNVKKSWHPGLARNQAKVKEREEEALAERKRSAERQQEIAKERELSELRALQGNAPASKLSWMYTDKQEKAATSDKESYLLGKRRIDTQALKEQQTVRKQERTVSNKNSADPMAAFLAGPKPKPKTASGPGVPPVSKTQRLGPRPIKGAQGSPGGPGQTRKTGSSDRSDPRRSRPY